MSYNTVMIKMDQKQNVGSHNGASTVNKLTIAQPATTASSPPVTDSRSMEQQDWLDTPAGKECLIKRIKEAEVYNKLHPRTYTSKEILEIAHAEIDKYARELGVRK